MSDIDQLLTRAEISSPTLERSLAESVAEAHAGTRRRRTAFAGCGAAVTIAVCGSLAYAAISGDSASPHRSTTHLAAYDHVIGADPDRPGRSLVVGPLDEHTASCTKLPDFDVRPFNHHGSTGVLIAIPANDPGGRIELNGQDLSQSPLYVFSCPGR